MATYADTFLPFKSVGDSVKTQQAIKLNGEYLELCSVLLMQIKMVLVGRYCVHSNFNLYKSELCDTVYICYGRELDAFTHDMKHLVSHNHNLIGLIVVKK